MLGPFYKADLYYVVMCFGKWLDFIDTIIFSKITIIIDYRSLAFRFRSVIIGYEVASSAISIDTAQYFALQSTSFVMFYP